MRAERWLPVPGYEGLYSVSDRGQIMSMNYNGTGLLKILKPGNSRGYNAVELYKDGDSRRVTVHRIVMAAFVGPRPDGLQINHKNGIKRDNRLENLEYVTRSENQKHSFRMGLQSNVGEKHSRAKLTDAAVKEILVRISNGERVTDIARSVGVHQTNISHIKRGRIWAHVRAGEPL